MKKKAAVFLDRDGTINIDTGYVGAVEDFKFLPGVKYALADLKKKGFITVLISNQSGVGRGYFDAEAVDKVHDFMQAELEAAGVKLDAIYYCPHEPENDCDCRKPNPAMVFAACDKYDIDPLKSYFVGDKESDVNAGKNAGCKSILLTEEKKETNADFVAADLVEAAAYIIKDCN